MANNLLIASDNFQRSGPALGSNWAAMFGDAEGQIVGNVVEPVSVSVSGAQIWAANTFPNDQISEVTIANLTASGTTYINLVVRSSASASTFYYANFDSSGTVSFFKVINGSSTQLGSTVSGLSFSAGTVISLQAAGSLFSIYVNYARVFFIGDISIPSGGLPGFVVFSSVSIGDSQVSSWRGYSSVQQDGIWQKQNIIIPVSSLDGALGNGNPSGIFFEGNAQILSGTVYKMWFGSNNVEYAESTNGINWTNHGSNVIANIGFPRVFKVGSAYHLYGSNVGGSLTNHYTSTDGINWTLATSNILPPGGTGQWDSGFIYYLTPVFIDGNGIWHGIYQGGIAGNTQVQHLGVATSPDGATWTKYAGNPVLANVGSGVPYQIGSTYYMWGPVNQLGRENGSVYLPTETMRVQSTDLINWTNLTRSVHVSEIFEGVNTAVGQAVYKAVINIGGKAYLYGTSTPTDVNNQVYQVGLAIGPASVESIVTANEDAVQQVATDSFINGLGPLSTDWVTPTGGTALTIVSGPAVQSSVLNSTGIAAYIGASFSNDQYSEVTVKSLTDSGDLITPIVRLSPTSLTYYYVNLSGPAASLVNTLQIFKQIAGVATAIGPSTSFTPQIGDVFRLQVIGNVISFFQNGGLILQVNDVNNSITSGFPGFSAFASTASGNNAHAQVNLWTGGNANVVPSYTTGQSGSGSITLLDQPLSGVTVTWVGPTSGQTKTDTFGNWTTGSTLLAGLYTIVPILTGYTFIPPQIFVDGSQNSIELNFIASRFLTAGSFPPPELHITYSGNPGSALAEINNPDNQIGSNTVSILNESLSLVVVRPNVGSRGEVRGRFDQFTVINNPA